MAVSVHGDMDGFGLSLGDMKNVGFNFKKIHTVLSRIIMTRYKSYKIKKIIIIMTSFLLLTIYSVPTITCCRSFRF